MYTPLDLVIKSDEELSKEIASELSTKDPSKEENKVEALLKEQQDESNSKTT